MKRSEALKLLLGLPIITQEVLKIKPIEHKYDPFAAERPLTPKEAFRFPRPRTNFDEPYIYGMGAIPEGAIDNGQGGWYYPVSGNICNKPLNFNLEGNNTDNVFYKKWEEFLNKQQNG